MKISVIVPYKEGLAYLDDCLCSLKEQIFQDIEIIIVCDRCRDNIMPMIESYGSYLNISVYELGEDKSGVAAARNLGLEKAIGEYIYFLDSDDYLFEDTLDLLVKETMEKEIQVAYGKKKSSWFAKNVFFATYQEELIENEDDEVGSSFESAQLKVENGGEEESNSSIDDNQMANEDETENEDESDSIRSEAEEALLLLQELEKEKQKAHNILISKRKGISNISVLNVLIQRELIENYQIRFHEDLLYFSDFPFLVKVLEHANHYKKCMRAKYVKRKHNDSVNLPALSQIKDQNRFAEFIHSYYLAVKGTTKDSQLKDRIDRKMIIYYTKLYAPRIRRSRDDSWRTDKFDTMRKIARDMNPEIIRKLKGYRKKVMKALIQGNLKKTVGIINKHLAWIKFNKLRKSQRARMKYLYKKFFLQRPMKENWVILESFFGKNYSDSPKYIYEYLSKNYPGKYKFIWVIDKKNTKIPHQHIKVKRFSYRYAYYMARSKYYVFNSRQPEWAKKRKGNIFLQTWHGTPLKKLVFDQDDVSSATPRYKAQVYKQSRAWDYLIAANYFSSETFKRCFMYHKTMLETGYPRNDILHHENKDAIAVGIKEKLKLPKEKKTILYAPTWRDDEFYEKGQYKFALQMNLHQMKAELGEEYVILLRTHYFIADALDVTGLEDFAYNLSKYDDISELYLISDILITDYSSVFFDYANLKRPMLFFTYDLEKYRDVLRGFYINIEEELPGPLVFTTEEIIQGIKNIDEIKEQYVDKYKLFYEKYCGLEDGTASEKVAKAVFQLGGSELE